MEFIEMFHLGLPPQIDFCAFPCYTCLVGVGTDYRQQKKPLRLLARAGEQSLSETSRTIQTELRLIALIRSKVIYGGKSYDKQ